MGRPITDLEETLRYSFQSPELLRNALTHSSRGEAKNYERLEFLGDRVLGLVVADLLYSTFPNEKEGDLAKRLASLVQGKTLAQLSSRISLGEYILFSDAEAAAGGAENDHILADVFEAVIGAMYVDGGFAPCQKVITEHWQDVLHTMKEPPQHPKTAIQEWAQSKGLPLPIYEIAGQSGPDHAPVFEIRLLVKGHEPILASGKSRAEAEKNAAKDFMSGVK